MTNYTLTAAAGSLAITGQTTLKLKWGYKVRPTTGIYTITGVSRNSPQLVKLNRSRTRVGYPNSPYKHLPVTDKFWKLRWWRR